MFSCHAQPPTDPMPSRASVGECATPHARTFNPDPPPLLALPSEPGYAPHVYAASQPLQHRREWVTARRTGRVRERRKGVNSCGLTAMVVKRKDTQYGVRRSTNVSYHVCSSRVPPFERLRLEARGLSLNVALQLNGSLHYRITQLVIHQHQPESQELLRRRTRSRPNPAEGLASHSCEAGLSQCHPHIARYHTTTCQQLANSAEGVTPPRRSTPFNGLRSYKPVRFMGVDQQHIMPAFEVVAFLQVGSLWRTSRR